MVLLVEITNFEFSPSPLYPLPGGKGGREAVFSPVIESEGDFVPLAHPLCSPSPKFGGHEAVSSSGGQGEGGKYPF